MDELQALIGTELGKSSWIMITQDMVDRFAKVTMDEQWIHVDVDRARQFMPDTGTIVHGYFTLSLVSPMMSEAFTWPPSIQTRKRSTINYGLNKVRFTNTVPVGSRVRGKFTLVGVTETAKGDYLVTVGAEVEIEGQDRPALVSENLILLNLG
jgi:acyl dehydratase